MPPPLGIYLHWPYCARICPYCDFNVVRDRGRAEDAEALVDAILTDLETQRGWTGARDLVSIYFGGGTPSLMTPSAVAGLIASIIRLWAPEASLEVTLEANPTDIEVGRLKDFVSAGVNRVSLGVQALEDTQLRFLGRNHDADEGRRAIDSALRITDRVSVDLIYALPGQSLADWENQLSLIASLGPDHISPYQLTLEAGTAMARSALRGQFQPIDPDLGASFYDVTQTVLEAQGFDAYEVSNHARGVDRRARHNLIYWRSEDYVGVGPGAHGRLTLGPGRMATIAHRKVKAYIEAVALHGHGLDSREILTPLARAEERLVMGLRTDEGVALAELWAGDLRPDPLLVAHYQDLGLLQTLPNQLVATRQGRLVLDSLTKSLILGVGS